MRKTMYSAMKNLAEYIAGNESYDFETIWKEWSSKYKPLEETTKELKKICDDENAEEVCFDEGFDKVEISWTAGQY